MALTTLTNRQAKQLRGLAHHLDPVINIGKEDISEGLVRQADQALEAHELIKCSVQNGSSLTVSEAADALAAETGAELVQVIGHKFVLYRESSRDDIEKIELV